MLKALPCLLLALTLTSCSFFSVHKQPIEQGNIITQSMTSKLHNGMTESQVLAVMGQPVLKNLFTNGQISYIYTYQLADMASTQKRVICIFNNGRLNKVMQST